MPTALRIALTPLALTLRLGYPDAHGEPALIRSTHVRQFAARLAVAAALLPGTAAAAELRLTAGDLQPLADGVWMAPGLTLPDPDPALPLFGEALPAEISRPLRRALKSAHGFAGIVYDNRDRGHSQLAPDLFPQLTHLVYAPELHAAGADQGLAGAFLLPAVVFGNSSTAVTSGPIARSLPRLAMTTGAGPAANARLYRNDHLYVYPEHRDHDAADRFPANWPYMVISQGSSGSDRVFLQAIASTLAAFPADTFAAMRDEGLVAPTLQMILRRNLEGVADEADYFTGAAHPVAIEGSRLRPGRMISQAAAMTPEAMPPLVALTVEEESFTEAAGLAGLSERLFDTPQAVARIWRDWDWEREMVVRAEIAAGAEEGVTFDWRLLQGDPERVAIEPLDEEGRRARLRIAWHDPWEVPRALDRDAARAEETPVRQLSRIDIAVFARRPGAAPSAPAFVTVAFPAHQIRRYAPRPDGRVQLVSVDYDAAGRGAYVDPLLHWSAPWTDRPVYDAAGTLISWDRTRSSGETVTSLPSEPGYSIDRTTPRMPVLEEAGQ